MNPRLIKGSAKKRSPPLCPAEGSRGIQKSGKGFKGGHFRFLGYPRNDLTMGWYPHTPVPGAQNLPLSTARLPQVAAAVLPVADFPPVVGGYGGQALPPRQTAAPQIGERRNNRGPPRIIRPAMLMIMVMFLFLAHISNRLYRTPRRLSNNRARQFHIPNNLPYRHSRAPSTVIPA